MTDLIKRLVSELRSDKKALWVIGVGITTIFGLGFGMMVLMWVMITRPNPRTTVSQDSGLLYTQALETVLSELTQQALLNTMTPTETPTPVLIESSTETWTDQEPSPTTTPSITTTFTPTSSPSAIPPTPTRIIPSLTPVPVVCNSAQFVRDVTVMDNTLFAPDTAFIKTWRVKNTGSCTWTQDYSLVFVYGNAMSAKQSVSLPVNVTSNQTVDVSVSMRSPLDNGSYRGDWMLNTPTGTRFGTGSSGTGPLYVAIKVRNLANPNFVYDFAANYCKAQWQSGAGNLPCPGTSSGSDGFVTLLDMPKLENRQEDELALWTHPQSIQNGWISGIYPEINIQPGHHFVAWIGCLADSKGCNVTFRLDFLNTKSGQVKSLGSWQEVFDGKVTVIDLNLSPHAGKNVRFILTVEVSGGDQTRANAFWFVPAIVQGAVPSITPTSTATGTSTPTPTNTATSTETPTD